MTTIQSHDERIQKLRNALEWEEFEREVRVLTDYARHHAVDAHVGLVV